MELSLDSVFIPKPISEFLTELKGGAAADRDAKIAEYRTRLEDEMRKIEVFKRELPLCMLILQDAIERLKEEDRVVVVEEFIPMKKKKKDESNGVVLEKENSDMKSWMSSVQLWSSTNFDDTKSELKLRNEDVDRSVPVNSIENPIEVSKKRSRGGAFMPFKGNHVTEDKEVSEVPSLSLGTPMCEVNGANNGNFKSSARGGSGLSMVKLQIEAQQMSPMQQQQCFRKQRRCWSPELHCRFVDALQKLGGSQVATPKQIRELMQVDGLTNDEVKSHLQKYRLHIRKVPGSSATEANGSWMDQDHCGDNSKENSSQSRSPQGPLLAKEGPSTTGGNSSETDEDDQKSLKSDGYSWKAASHNSSGDV